MSISVEEVRYIARLARLQVAPGEEERIAAQMSRILDYVDQLKELDTEGVAPMSHVLPLQNVVREDAVRPRITHEDALRSAPDADEDFFRVPRVIE